MKKRIFNIHKKIQLVWNNPSFTIHKKRAMFYSFFEDFNKNTEHAVKIEVYNSVPPKKVTISLKKAAERFAFGDNIIKLEHNLGFMRWTTWIQNIDSNDIKIWYQFKLINRVGIPLFVYPDKLFSQHIIQPLIDYKLSLLGITSLNSISFANAKEEGVIIAGLKNEQKNECINKITNDGFSLIADDISLFDSKDLFSYPLNTDKFKNINKKNDVINTTKIKGINLVLSSKNEKSKIEYDGIMNSQAIEKLLGIAKLECLNYIDIEEIKGRFLIQLDQVFGTNVWDEYWQNYKNSLLKLNDISCKIITLGEDLNYNLILT